MNTMRNAQNNYNYVAVTGTIASELTLSHEKFRKSFFRFYLEVERKSGQIDSIPCILPDSLLTKEQKEAFCKGTRLTAIGELRSRNYSDEANVHHAALYFFVEMYFRSLDTPDGQDVCFQGTIVSPPTYRKTPLGREITDLLLAIHRRSYGRSDYLPCIAWESSARKASRFQVGDLVQVTGRIQSRIYTKQLETGSQTRTAYEVSIRQIEKLEMENGNEKERKRGMQEDGILPEKKGEDAYETAV